MKIKLESKQGVEVLADTLDETLDALHVRPAPILRRPVEVTSERVVGSHFGEKPSHRPPRSPAQEHDTSPDARVANLLQRQSFTTAPATAPAAPMTSQWRLLRNQRHRQRRNGLARRTAVPTATG